MKRLIIVGSPRTNGRSAHLAEMLFETNIDEHPEDELFLVPVSEVEIGPCIGCNACRKKSGVIVKGDDGAEVTLQRHRCVFDDDMQTLYDLLDDVDEVTVVSPVYFSGAPAPMKCVLDRLQPYFWARVEVRESGDPLPDKRPLTLHVLGEGGDPHGYDALVSEVKSAFATADFRLERVLDWVGKLDEAGEITAEATEITFAGGAGAAGEGADAGATVASAGLASSSARTAGANAATGKAKSRPKLDLHSNMRDPEPDSGKTRPASKGSPAAKSQSSKGSPAAKGQSSKGSSTAKRRPAKGAAARSGGSASGRPKGKRHGK